MRSLVTCTLHHREEVLVEGVASGSKHRHRRHEAHYLAGIHGAVDWQRNALDSIRHFLLCEVLTALFPFHVHDPSVVLHGVDMAPPRGSAAYKKQDGTLAISKDAQSVSWTPVTPPGSKPTVTFPLSTITSQSRWP